MNIFLYLYENFSLVDWYKIWKIKLNRCKNVVCFVIIVVFWVCNMINKESLYIFVYVLEINIRWNYVFLLFFCESEGNLLKMFCFCNWVEYLYGKIFIMVVEILVIELVNFFIWMCW